MTLLPLIPYMNGNIYVVGDLTQWRMDEQSRMEYNPDLHAYQLRLLLKQGYYAYQLLFVPVGESEGLTSTLESITAAPTTGTTAWQHTGGWTETLRIKCTSHRSN